MLRSRIIPCLLLHKGGLVKTTRFKDPKYIGDPLNVVKIFNEKQVDELMFLDIDATACALQPSYSLLKDIAAQSRMPLSYGGGIKSVEQAINIISLGFEKIVLSEKALSCPGLITDIANAIGSQSVVVALDVRKSQFGSGYTIYTHNGQKKKRFDFFDFIKWAVELGAGELLINSIDRDGMMIGYDLQLATKIRSLVECPLSFMGGAGTVAHMQELINNVGVVGAAAGSLFVFKGPYRAVLISYDKPPQLMTQDLVHV